MRVEQVTDKAALRQLMNVDALESAYALGDLSSPFWELSEFWGGYQDDKLAGLVLIYRGFDPPSLTMHGDPHVVAHILDTITLPDEVFSLFPATYLESVTQHYHQEHLHRLLRMVLHEVDFVPPEENTADDVAVRRITSSEVNALNALYATASIDAGEAVVAFQARQVEAGVFYGVFQSEALVAAAGTHVASHEENIAAIGNVFTHPNARRQGFGSLSTAAVAQALFENGIMRVVLNVKQKNYAAQTVYQKLGFHIYTDFIEGPALKI